MEGVEIGVLIEERNGQIKGSFRAKNESFRVDLLAKEFNGGGHACAAGFNLEGNLDDFYPLLVEKIGHYLSGIKLSESSGFVSVSSKKESFNIPMQTRFLCSILKVDKNRCSNCTRPGFSFS